MTGTAIEVLIYSSRTLFLFINSPIGGVMHFNLHFRSYLRLVFVIAVAADATYKPHNIPVGKFLDYNRL